MRCVCCNKALSDYEATIKSSSTGEYLDMCVGCLSHIPEVEFIDRPDLSEVCEDIEGNDYVE